MENRNLSTKISVSLFHWPTVMILVGYIVYWAELFFIPRRDGTTTSLAASVALCLLLYIIVSGFKGIKQWVKDYSIWFAALENIPKLFIFCSGILTIIILIISGKAALLPPHLMQEYDALNYHLTIPRQHLILGSMDWIRWSTGDLLLMGLDYALAPFWFLTALPNKIPQFLTALGLLGVSFSIVKHFSDDYWAPTIAVFVIAASHAIGIQMGTAMMDLVMCYLFIAAVDSLLKGRTVLSALEFSLFFWSKSFIPIQMGIIVSGILIVAWVIKRLDWEVVWFRGRDQLVGRFNRRFWITFVLAAMIFGLPFLVRTLYYTGTPLYPFKPGLIKVNPDMDRDGPHWALVTKAAEVHMDARDSYGHGRGILAFFKHFWIVAVPEQGVNNAYDYPLGLPYLLFAGPFAYLVILRARKKELSILDAFIIIYWLTWWMGSHQARFLYVPLILIYIAVLINFNFRSKVFMGAILLALLANSVSVLRAHKHDLLAKDMKSVLRVKDKAALALNEEYLKAGRTDMVAVDAQDQPFARFPIKMTKVKYPFAIGMER